MLRRLGWLGRFWNRFFRRQAAPPDRLPARLPAQVPDPVTRKVCLLIIDPSIPSQQGRQLSGVLGWNDPDALVDGLIADLLETSHGYANYTIVERLLSPDFPLKADGFRYTPDAYLRAWQSREGFHQPDAIDYQRILDQFDIIDKINAGAIDEVWTVSFPYAGFYESRMAGPGAFWCNAPPLKTGAAGRRFIIMAFNYERGVGEMLESYGHRAESILQEVHHKIAGPRNLWMLYTLYDKIAPGQAQVGNIHFAPNSQRDYDWGNLVPVASRCRNWPHFPDLSGPPVMVNCREWGNGDIRLHHRWWFSLLPHLEGETYGIANNWWRYIVDPNEAI